MSEVKIREAKIEDSQAITDLTLQLEHDITLDETKERLEHILKDKSQVILVAEVNNKVLGYANVKVNYELLNGIQARLEGLVVDSNTRGLGIGRKLMEKVDDWSRKQGSRTLKFVSNMKRVEAHGFYEKIGYEKSKVQQQFKKVL